MADARVPTAGAMALKMQLYARTAGKPRSAMAFALRTPMEACLALPMPANTLQLGTAYLSPV